uniref:Uncharacterized protein n=1 Tax=Arundo donax TaxID=35708 RepID=A0A0A9DWH3_ARUDO
MISLVLCTVLMLKAESHQLRLWRIYSRTKTYLPLSLILAVPLLYFTLSVVLL